jgi:hypothetical protein
MNGRAVLYVSADGGVAAANPEVVLEMLLMAFKQWVRPRSSVCVLHVTSVSH